MLFPGAPSGWIERYISILLLLLLLLLLYLLLLLFIICREEVGSWSIVLNNVYNVLAFNSMICLLPFSLAILFYKEGSSA